MPEPAPIEPALSADDLVTLRQNLHEQRLFRREQLQQLSDSAMPRADALLDRQSAARTEVRVKLAASARMVLADVEAALRRMDRGDYGACHLCRRPIARERLTIVPQARYCARCQQVQGADR
ncbi:TraR/DksA C4-type zinc finger protein [Streptomyces sp. NPDC002855]|uniref:TraR/DksA family transcriptional regulator n=1 Tax=unclassified Streptomyces TaxID=2593676 RepID=UPI003329A050